MSHAGQYECSAHNGVGADQSRIVSLEVEFPPELSMPSPRIPQVTHTLVT